MTELDSSKSSNDTIKYLMLDKKGKTSLVKEHSRIIIYVRNDLNRLIKTKGKFEITNSDSIKIRDKYFSLNNIEIIKSNSISAKKIIGGIMSLPFVISAGMFIASMSNNEIDALGPFVIGIISSPVAAVGLFVLILPKKSYYIKKHGYIITIEEKYRSNACYY